MMNGIVTLPTGGPAPRACTTPGALLRRRRQPELVVELRRPSTHAVSHLSSSWSSPSPMSLIGAAPSAAKRLWKCWPTER